MKSYEKAEITQLFEGFSCLNDEDVDNFLRNQSFEFERTHNSRTFLLLSSDENLSHPLIGYFALTFKEISIESPIVSKNELKKIDGFSKNPNSVRGYLIAQVGKNKLISDNPINFGAMLEEIYGIISTSFENLGGRVLILECKDNVNLISFYEKFGFKVLQKDELVQMYKIIEIA